ncbi:MAG: oxidoreductase [Planctomycetaceae bacterium]|nr:oxidoreductase [Planctomycetaceae bacterium]
MTLDQVFYLLGVIVVVSPLLLLAVLGITTLTGRPLSERAQSRLTEVTVLSGLISAVLVLILMLCFDRRHVPLELGHWVDVAEEHFHFHLKFVFDRLSVPFVILTYVLVGTIGAFASRYLHRESGFHRFFFCYALFLTGMVASTIAGTIETLFFGWEFVGLSSALLVAFYLERRNPVRNGLRVWTVYRVADAAFLLAALTLHHLTGAGDFDALSGSGPWPEGATAISSQNALFVGLLLLAAAAGKSALVPFSGWLPRAMEGPTPSSAVFYGSLSVHLGAFLLLRCGSLIAASTILSVMVVIVGLVTAIFAAITARVQTDIKSSLAFASLTQVGIIIAEIGLGFRYLALVHIIGHACLRTLQLLRAPSLLQDYNTIENAIGTRLPERNRGMSRFVSQPLRRFLYRFAVERGYLDALLDEFIVYPFIAVFRQCNRWEQRWTDFLSGSQTDSGGSCPDDRSTTGENDASQVEDAGLGSRVLPLPD